MLRLLFTDEAKRDLINIRSYTLGKWGTLKAKNYISELRRTLAQLQIQPLIGTDKSVDLGAGVRVFPYVSHMIYYRVVQNDLLVLALLHQSMVPELHLSPQDND